MSIKDIRKKLKGYSKAQGICKENDPWITGIPDGTDTSSKVCRQPAGTWIYECERGLREKLWDYPTYLEHRCKRPPPTKPAVPLFPAPNKSVMRIDKAKYYHPSKNLVQWMRMEQQRYAKLGQPNHSIERCKFIRPYYRAGLGAPSGNLGSIGKYDSRFFGSGLWRYAGKVPWNTLRPFQTGNSSKYRAEELERKQRLEFI